MDIIYCVVLGTLAIIGAIVTRILTDEAKAWLPWGSKYLTRLAVQMAPAEVRERYDEEWRGHLDAVPGDLGRLYVSIGFVVAAHNLASHRAHFRTYRSIELRGKFIGRSIGGFGSMVPNGATFAAELLDDKAKRVLKSGDIVVIDRLAEFPESGYRLRCVDHIDEKGHVHFGRDLLNRQPRQRPLSEVMALVVDITDTPLRTFGFFRWVASFRRRMDVHG